jgi:hypothetical protein
MILEGLLEGPIYCPNRMAIDSYVSSLREQGFDIQSHYFHQDFEHWRSKYGIYELRGFMREATRD